MKKLIISLLVCLVSVYLYGQDHYMYVNGQKRYFDVSETKMLVKSETLDASDIKEAMQRTNGGSVRNVYELHNRIIMVDMQTTSRTHLIDFQNQLNLREDVVYASPVFVDETGREIGGLTNQVLVRLRTEADYPLLQRAIAAYQIKTVEQCDYDKKAYLLTLVSGAEKNAMQTANELYETGLFEYAEPNLVQFMELASNDQHYQQQWGLHHNLYGIRAPQAWNITTGSQNIRIAVLDVGVDLQHPDLINRLLLGFDATGGKSAGAPTGNDNLNISHGTACAGIAAGQGNNDIGIAGVANNCRILPVRIARISNGWTATESEFIRLGINWAVNNEADVISMSFWCTETSALTTAIINAAASGRNNNLGCVLVACSHNQNQPNVTYPASRPEVIAVGAINNAGQRANFSNYGPNLDVVAPGVNIFVPGMLADTNNNLNFINNGTNGVYISNYDGTSAAAPHVAGIAALILSVNPYLSAVQVRNLIEQNCNKNLPSWSVTQTRANGTWNNQLGYGLVDAHAAIMSLPPVITGSTLVCFGSPMPFSSTIWQTGYYWDKSSNLTLSSTTASSITVSMANANSSGAGWVSVKNSNGVELVRYNLWVGTPVLLDISGSKWVAPGDHGYTAVTGGVLPQYITGYNWNLSPSSGYVYEYGINANIYFYDEDYYQVSARGINTCGTGSWRSVYVSVSNYSPAPVFYPNPVSDVLNVEMDATVNSRSLTYDVRLYDGHGNMLRQRFMRDGKIEFSVATLPNGIYYLHFYDGVNSTPEIHQIVVER